MTSLSLTSFNASHHFLLLAQMGAPDSLGILDLDGLAIGAAVFMAAIAVAAYVSYRKHDK